MFSRVLDFAASRGLTLTGLTYNSAEVRPGYAFFALKGVHHDGNAFIPDALKKGAALIVSARPAPADCGAAYFRSDDMDKDMADAAYAFYGRPSDSLNITGVTGTKGKTSIAYLAEAALAHAGKKVSVLGTVNYRINGCVVQDAPNTTPLALPLFKLLKQMKDAQTDALVMEVSSHSLEQQRVGGVPFAGALFTNLTQDHLDFHPDMLSYFKAKARLFLEVPRDDKAMSINADDEWGRRLLELCPSALSYGLHEALPGQRHLRGELLSAGTDGCHLRMTLGRESWELHSPLVGAFNASNLLAVQALALELGLKPDQLAVLAGFMGVCGRLERVPNSQGLHVFVDYAHTPDALINVLKALRGAGFRRIVAVFGCGGNRDRTKRPLMGQAVARYADVAVLTSDNPRFEDPEAILRDVLPGLADARETVVEVDRRTATARALELLGPDDALLIAGKGHEDYQIIQGVKHHYSDLEVVRELLGCA